MNLEGVEGGFALPVPQFATPIRRTSQEYVGPEGVASHFVNGPCVSVVTLQVLVN